MPFNLSATVNVLRCLKNPALLHPHCTISTFDQLPYPLSSAFADKPDIRAVVLDKDNCFATPYTQEVYPAYTVIPPLPPQFPPACRRLTQRASWGAGRGNRRRSSACGASSRATGC